MNEDYSTVGMSYVPINYSDNLVLTKVQIRHAGSVLYYSIMHDVAFSVTYTFLIKIGESAVD